MPAWLRLWRWRPMILSGPGVIRSNDKLELQCLLTWDRSIRPLVHRLGRDSERTRERARVAVENLNGEGLGDVSGRGVH